MHSTPSEGAEQVRDPPGKPTHVEPCALAPRSIRPAGTVTTVWSQPVVSEQRPDTWRLAATSPAAGASPQRTGVPKFAVTVFAASTVTLQTSAPEQPLPDQPSKAE